METNWRNWSESLSFDTDSVYSPESEEEIAELVFRAGINKEKIKVVGAGHSSSPLVKNDQLLSLKHFNGVEWPDLENNTAIVPAGMTVKAAGRDLYRYGLAMHNTGDVDVQTLAGAIGTGTHGTGKSLQNLSGMLLGVRMITGTGEILEVDKQTNPQLMKALQVGLGSCGIFLKLKVQLQPSYLLHRKEWCVRLKDCLDRFQDLKENNRNFDFYWYPRTDLCKIRVINKNEDPMPEIPDGTLELERTGPSHEILPRSRPLKFDEMEYALPEENALDCLMEIREQVKRKFRKKVAWRILVRTVDADEALLSPMYKRRTMTISLHQNAGLPFWDYFKAIEPVFRKYEGRPHWGKKHTLEAKDLEPLYPEWSNFMKIRQKMDPEGVFSTRYLDKLLNVTS